MFNSRQVTNQHILSEWYKHLTPIIEIINILLNIKLGQFTEEELNVILTKIKSRKAAGLDEIPAEVWKTRKFDDISLILQCRI